MVLSSINHVIILSIAKERLAQNFEMDMFCIRNFFNGTLTVLSVKANLSYLPNFMFCWTCILLQSCKEIQVRAQFCL